MLQEASIHSPPRWMYMCNYWDHDQLALQNSYKMYFRGTSNFFWRLFNFIRFVFFLTLCRWISRRLWAITVYHYMYSIFWLVSQSVSRSVGRLINIFQKYFLNLGSLSYNVLSFTITDHLVNSHVGKLWLPNCLDCTDLYKQYITRYSSNLAEAHWIPKRV